MCFDSLNSSDIACGEYASRTLAGKQAPSMATLFRVSHPDTWGENPDECRSSIHLGKIMGKK